MTLWPHQEEGVQRALAAMPGGFGLWWEMRTGKSRTAVETAKRMGAKRILVLCPSQAGAMPKVWAKEFSAQWPDHPTMLNLGDGSTGTERAERLRKMADRPVVCVVNIEACWREPLARTIGSQQWDLLICDEIHRLKSPTGAAARYVQRLARHIPNRLGLTGTPIPHNALDVWAQYQVLDWSVFPDSFTRFRLHYSRPAGTSERRDPDTYMHPGRGGILQRYKFEHMDELQDRMYGGGRLAMRVRTVDVFPDMPRELDEERKVALEPSARRIYREIERNMIAEIRLSMGGDVNCKHEFIEI